MAVGSDTATQTLSLLAERLKRIEYVLNGDSERNANEQPSEPQTGSAIARVRALERTLYNLSSESPAVADILALQKKHPDLFHPSANAEANPSISPSSLVALVLAHARLYQSISAQLPQLQDTPIPDTASATKLLELQPRVDRARERQLAQATELAELRTRSAIVVEKWYEGGVLGMGERWTDWEERLREVEILVRRREAVKRREEGTM